MEILLNRLRGTGEIFKIFSLGISGNVLYTLYIFGLFALVTNQWIALLVTIGYLLGESFGWGKWVGSLCYPNNINKENAYKDLEGYSFPWIHYMANSIVKEKENFLGYCNIALALRGAIWGLLIYLPLVVFSWISFNVYLMVILMYAIGFPLACYLSTKKYFNFKYKFISIQGQWESQEVYYGCIHFISNLIVIYYILRLL